MPRITKQLAERSRQRGSKGDQTVPNLHLGRWRAASTFRAPSAISTKGTRPLRPQAYSLRGRCA